MVALDYLIHSIYRSMYDFFISDYKSHKLRFVFESIAWLISIGCCIAMALTVPNPPLLLLYPIWMTGCAIAAGCSYSRDAFWLFFNYMLLTLIDFVGLVRMLL